MKKAPQLLVLAVVGLSLAAQAGPVGPSARMAAWLKKHPGSTWLAHYLPDDRYKIAGGVWKFVSTDLDTYYHRPDSPLMLRQSADRVIGFANSKDAEEAGYKPAPDAMGFGGFGGGSDTVFIKGRRVTLSDGVSSLTLPDNWRKTAGQVQNIQGGQVMSDQFVGPKGQFLNVFTYVPPASMNFDASSFFTVDNMKMFTDQLGKRARIVDKITSTPGSVGGIFQGKNMTQMVSEIQNGTNYSAVRVDGAKGVFISRKKALGTGLAPRSYAVGRGRKMWNIFDSTKSSLEGAKIVRSMKLR